MRKALESLIFVGTVTETYKLFGSNWVLKTLSNDEQLQTTATTREYDQISRLNAIKVATLARSIIEIDNIEVKDINEKLELLGKMQIPLIDMLYEKYIDLQKKQDEALKNIDEEIKN